MTNTVLLKKSNIANAIPVPGDLQSGELAINYTDGNLFFKDNSGNVQIIASKKFITVSGNVTGGNVVSLGNISATGNIAGNYFIGNGSQLTGITASLSGAMSGNISANGFQILGLPTLTTSGNLVAAGNITAIGNVSGTYFIGNGSLLTGIAGGAGNYSNANVAAYLPTYTGNVGAGNVNVTGAISATGNVRGSNLLTQGQVSAVGQIITPVTVSAGNVTTNGVIIATGNITTSSYLNGNGSQITGLGGPGFIAKQTAFQGIPSSPVSINYLSLIYNSVSQNVNAGYNASTGIFTAPKTGFYQVSGSIGINLAGNLSYYGTGALLLFHNGVSVASGPFIFVATLGGAYVVNQSSLSTLVYLNAGDILQLKLAYVTNAPTNLYTTQVNLSTNTFQACWLRS
jgi:hypothetical protein